MSVKNTFWREQNNRLSLLYLMLPLGFSFQKKNSMINNEIRKIKSSFWIRILSEIFGNLCFKRCQNRFSLWAGRSFDSFDHNEMKSLGDQDGEAGCSFLGQTQSPTTFAYCPRAVSRTLFEGVKHLLLEQLWLAE